MRMYNIHIYMKLLNQADSSPADDLNLIDGIHGLTLYPQIRNYQQD